MWDFEHAPLAAKLAERYELAWMTPAECADRLQLEIDAPDAADIGLVPVAALATTPGLRIIPGCAIAATRKVRSLLLVRRATQQLTAIRTVAADTSSRASLAYTEVMFRQWWNPDTVFIPHAPDLDRMLATADAALLIGDPALFALEGRQARELRTGESLIYHDLAAEWIALTGRPWVSAVWAVREESLSRSGRTIEELEADFTNSRDHGLEHVDELVEEWSLKMPIPAETIRAYLTTNIHYDLDEACMEGLWRFFELAEETGVLPSVADLFSIRR
jgi:chorismate dehydratase